jgi:LytS/YehU family sensor histidine kinase
MSGRDKITLSEEIQYLRNFLEMEKMKLDGQLNYTVKLDGDSRADLYEIPPLILQPYLEMLVKNVLNAGSHEMIRIDVRLSIESNELTCSIKNNALDAREQVITFNEELEEYSQKAVLLAKKRIDLLNELRQVKIQVNVPNGTRNDGDLVNEVIIKIPTTIYAESNPMHHH